jgi:fimbrial chaperone protein
MRGLLVVVIAVIALVRVAHAATFTVNPTEVSLSARGSSALVTLRNESDRAARFEITVFAWSETGGQMTLTPTTDVTFFPRLIELAPKATRNIRVGVTAKPGAAVERAYRLFVEELPDNSQPKGNAIAIRTKMGLPVFVRPEKTSRSAVLEPLVVENGRVVTRVRNTGTLHVNVEGITVNGSSATGARTFTREVPGWYVLAGETRDFALPLTAEECAASTTIDVEVRGHNSALKGRGTVPAGGCVAR